MKNRLLVVFIILGIGVANADSGFMLSITPGKLIEGFDLGYSFNGFVPMFGIDFASVSMSLTARYEEPDATYSDEASVGMTVFAPHLGFKYLFGKRHVHPYVGLSFLYTFGMASVESDGQADEFAEETLEDLLSGNWGIGFCFGGEYFFNENFSFSGDVGFKYYKASTKIEDEWAPGYTDILESSLGLGMTDVTWGLNFYF